MTDNELSREIIGANVPILKDGVRRFVMSEMKNTNAEDSKDAEVAEKTRNQPGKSAANA